MRVAWDGACLRVGGRARSAVLVGVAAGGSCGAGSSNEGGGGGWTPRVDGGSISTEGGAGGRVTGECLEAERCRTDTYKREPGG